MVKKIKVTIIDSENTSTDLMVKILRAGKNHFC